MTFSARRSSHISRAIKTSPCSAVVYTRKAERAIEVITPLSLPSEATRRQNSHDPYAASVSLDSHTAGLVILKINIQVNEAIRPD